MKQGDEIKCPHCGKNTFLKKISVMDGWTKKGEILACASCSAKIADLQKSPEEEKSKQSKSLSALASLLSETNIPQKPKFPVDDSEKQFCKDCKHFIKHPFNDKCGFHDKFVNPMDDCEDFERKNEY